MKVRWFGKTRSERCEYAGREELASVFECQRAGLQKLALLLTADEQAARRCMILAFRECIAGSPISREWALNWTRRMVIRNAISLVMGRENESHVNTNDGTDSALTGFSPDDSPGANAESESILDLPELDRFVFVICVLERYSMYDCALLLGRSPRDINEARQRVGNRVGNVDEVIQSSQRFVMR
jgi:DNA-directed RNA polymerase specialized sigma24 family protein